MDYHCKTEVGTFWICPDPEISGQYRLYIDHLWIGSYFSPESAANDVYTQTTGHDAWDLQDEVVFEPRDLSEWQRGKPEL
jgi:hypothetical protein